MYVLMSVHSRVINFTQIHVHVHCCTYSMYTVCTYLLVIVHVHSVHTMYMYMFLQEFTTYAMYTARLSELE